MQVVSSIDMKGSFILDRMRMEAVERRLGNILSTDWEAEALTFSLGSL